MKFNSKTLLKDKNVLRGVAFIAVINLIAYVMVLDYDAVAFFAIVGFLTTYFSKNMIVVLLVAMITTNLLVFIRSKNRTTSEGFGGKGGERKGKASVRDASLDFKPADISGGDKRKGKANVRSASSGVRSATSDEDDEMVGGAGKLNSAATISETYENLENMLDSGAIKKMSGKTKELAKRQKNLHKQIQTLAPAMKQSFALLNSMGGAEGVNGMINSVQGMIKNFGGLSGQK